MARDLDKLHPKVKEAALQLKALAAEKGLKIIFTQTLRTKEEQAAFYAQGRQPVNKVNVLRGLAGLGPITDAENKSKITNASTIADSFHGYGLAFDIAITDSSGKKIVWNDKSDWNGDGVDDWYTVGKLADKIPGLEWGGNWNKLPDPPHYQMRFGLTIADLKAGKRP